MIRLSKLSAALLVLISFTAMALLAEILYLLWRRRFFFRPRNTARGPTQQDLDFAAERKISMAFMSKELLRYLCCRHHLSRIEPNEAVHASSPSPSAVSSPSSSQEHDEEEQLKWCGRTRLLFTIKEEESEGEDSDNGSSVGNSRSSSLQAKAFVFEDDFSAVLVSDMTKATAKTVAEDCSSDMKETTPFSTPCASPPYLTPWSSPCHDVEFGTVGSWDAFLLRDSRSEDDQAVDIR